MKTSMLNKTRANLDMLQLLYMFMEGARHQHFPSGIAMDESDGTGELWT
jgi:hypothetical protein